MAAINLLSGLMQVIPNTAAAAIYRERAEALKDVILANEARFKLATEIADHLRKENESLKKEVEALRGQMAFQAISTEFKQVEGLLFREGSETPHCVACHAVMSQRGYRYKCTKCDYEWTKPHASVASSSPSQLREFERRYGPI